MSKPSRQPGDRVRITVGQRKGLHGRILSKASRGWEIALDNGNTVVVPFPHVAPADPVLDLIGRAEGLEAETDTETALHDLPPVNAAGEVTVEVDLNAVQEVPSSPQVTDEPGGSEDDASATESNSDQAKMGIKALQALAKSRGVGIARTRDDLLIYILQKEPDADPGQLRGRVLFDTVNRLHISRLRSKADFIRLLA
ncbi:MAG: hypothetical protein FJY67_07570 [Calditrichaeota bacterium]|nr:hypothetical protein [Calditrichota bacterium]